jgi:dTMP kinase
LIERCGAGTLRIVMQPGHLIVLEGVDGAGTTTHTRLLSEALRARKVPVHVSAEPSGGPVGALLRQMLTGRVVAADSARPPAWNAMALLFAADRIDHLDSELLPNLNEGVTVLCDRYYHSSVAYQSLTGGGIEAIGWLREINRHARRPDLTIVLDVSPEVAAERRRRRRGSSEIFDSDELQTRLCEFYRGLERYFPEERIVHVESDGELNVVAARVLAHAQSLIAAQ